MSRFHVFFFVTVLLALLHFSDADLDTLRSLRRKCYRDLSPCVMFMNEQKAFGCAQCGDDIRSAPLREFRSLDELILFTNGEAETRIVMIPEFIFFSSKVVARLAAAPRNVAAVIVFEGAGDALNVPEEPSGQPVEPIIVRSDDDTEPNRRYNFYNLTELPESCDDSDEERNPGAFCLKFRFFPFNIFRVNATVADEIRFLAARFPNQNLNEPTLPGGPNNTSPVVPRYKIDSVGQMYACPLKPAPTPNAEEASQESAAEAELLVTSEQCLSERTCLPIGGHSLWSSLGHLDRTAPASRDILAITAPMDSIAFFNDVALGASAEISSLAVMMAVAEAVGNYRRGKGAQDTMKRQPVFFAWNAQSWGYAGSGRFLKDIKDFECEEQADLTNFRPGCLRPFMPSLKFLDFRGANFSVLNIGQMITPNRTDIPVTYQFYTHGRNPADDSGQVEQALNDSFSELPEFSEVGLKAGDEGVFTRYIPIDASQSFRRYMPDVDMITVANHLNTFTNRFYHTSFDNQSKTESPPMLRSPMFSAARAIASAIINLSFEATVPAADIEINSTVIEEAVICLTGNWSRCDLGREYLGTFYEARAGSIVPGNYAGSFFPFTRLRDRNPSGAAKLNFIRSFFAYQTRYEVSEARCETVRDCDDFINAINTRVSPQSQSQLRSAFCTKGVCVASDTYTHNAFGTALNSTNAAQSSFQYDTSKLKEEFNGSEPQEAGWTESVWDPDLGLCGFVEDTPAYGGIILFAGLVVLLASLLLSLSLDRLMFRKPTETDQETETIGPQETPV